jgi:hypothetical protein
LCGTPLGNDEDEELEKDQQLISTANQRAQAAELICPHCGSRLEKGQLFCLACGSPVGSGSGNGFEKYQVPNTPGPMYGREDFDKTPSANSPGPMYGRDDFDRRAIANSPPFGTDGFDRRPAAKRSSPFALLIPAILLLAVLLAVYFLFLK